MRLTKQSRVQDTCTAIEIETAAGRSDRCHSHQEQDPSNARPPISAPSSNGSCKRCGACHRRCISASNAARSQIVRSQVVSEIREAMPRGKAVDRFLTELTGTPLKGQQAWNMKPVDYLIRSVLALVLGTELAAVAVLHGGLSLLVLPLAFILQLNGLRNLSLSCLHEAGHGAFFRAARWANDLLGEAIGVLTLIENYSTNQVEHNRNHHGFLMTADDPTVRFQISVLGLRPGEPEATQWAILIRRILSPLFHLRMLLLRAKAYYNGASTTHVVLSGFYFAVIVALVFFFGFELVLWAWLFPLSVPLNVVLMIKECVEHTYPSPGLSCRKERMLSSTHQVRYGEPAPQNFGKMLLVWWPKMLFVYWPLKAVLYPGETVCHDWHHRHAKHYGWADCIFQRRDEVERVLGSQQPAYTHIWGGAPAALRETFRSLSRLPKDSFAELDGSVSVRSCRRVWTEATD